MVGGVEGVKVVVGGRYSAHSSSSSSSSQDKDKASSPHIQDIIIPIYVIFKVLQLYNDIVE